MSTDWTRGYGCTTEYWIVDPGTWADAEHIDNVDSLSVTRNSTDSLVESATLTLERDLGECYVRAYLVAEQDEVSERVPLATFLVQTPNADFDGKAYTRSVTGYSPLLELQDDKPPIGYTTPEGANVSSQVSQIMRNHMRAPLVADRRGSSLDEAFTAEDSENWLDYVKALLEKESLVLSLDAYGRVHIGPKPDAKSQSAVWEFKDGRDSILMPDANVEVDWYGLPNVVQVTWSGNDKTLSSEAVNSNPNSALSTESRGRRVVYRETSPELPDNPAQVHVDLLAEKLLREKSVRERRVTVSHAYCPVRVGDAVTIDYERAGLYLTAVVESQQIECDAHGGCLVTSTCVYEEEL